jgi:hypothetical protein
MNGTGICTGIGKKGLSPHRHGLTMDVSLLEREKAWMEVLPRNEVFGSGFCACNVAFHVEILMLVPIQKAHKNPSLAFETQVWVFSHLPFYTESYAYARQADTTNIDR